MQSAEKTARDRRLKEYTLKNALKQHMGWVVETARSVTRAAA
jgi:hypothetical protein